MRMPEDEIIDDDIQHPRHKRFSASMQTGRTLLSPFGESCMAIPPIDDHVVTVGSSSDVWGDASHSKVASMVSTFGPSIATTTTINATTKCGATTKLTAVELEERFQAVLQIADSPQNLSEEVEVMNEMMMVSQEELDALCAREMWGLSVQEREDVLYDIHGVAEVMEETPEFCQEQVRLLELELGLLAILPSRRQRPCTEDASTKTGETTKTRTTIGAAYIKALQQNEAYVKACYFMFLRANRWNPKKAADRMILFFQTKLVLFGPSALTEKITIERHLTKEDRQALESGKFQLLPVRDTAGRAIVVCIPPLRDYKHPDNVVR